MRRPWLIYAETDEDGWTTYTDRSTHTYESFISDDDISDMLHNDADAFFAKKINQGKGFDIRPTMKERLVYFMIDEEISYLLTGKVLNNAGVTLKSINIIRRFLGLSELNEISSESALKNRQQVPFGQLFSWMYYEPTIIKLKPYSNYSDMQIDEIINNRDRQAKESRIRHEILVKHPDKLRNVFGLEP